VKRKHPAYLAGCYLQRKLPLLVCFALFWFLRENRAALDKNRPAVVPHKPKCEFIGFVLDIPLCNVACLKEQFAHSLMERHS
jgi:hypothetical protein